MNACWNSGKGGGGCSWQQSVKQVSFTVLCLPLRPLLLPEAAVHPSICLGLRSISLQVLLLWCLLVVRCFVCCWLPRVLLLLESYFVRSEKVFLFAISSFSFQTWKEWSKLLVLQHFQLPWTPDLLPWRLTLKETWIAQHQDIFILAISSGVSSLWTTDINPSTWLFRAALRPARSCLIENGWHSPCLFLFCKPLANYRIVI